MDLDSHDVCRLCLVVSGFTCYSVFNAYESDEPRAGLHSRCHPPKAAHHREHRAGVDCVSCEPAILEEAARMKAGGGLSVADAWIAATAVVREAVLVHKDREFARVRQVRQERLRR